MNLRAKTFNLINRIPWFLIGALVAFGMILPYIVLGRGVYISANDQLDGEVINYIFNARYFGANYVQEILGGVAISALTPPSPAGVLLYKIFEPFTAFAMMHCIGIAAGYVGMFLLLRELLQNDPTDNVAGKLIPAVVAAMFVYLPFYPVYGLSVYGQPLVAWAVVRLWRLNSTERSLIRELGYYLVILICSVSSSLALVGFAWIGVLTLVLMVSLIGRRESAGACAIAWATMVLSYVCTNIPLFKEVLGLGESYVSHRTEMTVSELDNLWEEFVHLFLNGGLYVRSYNKYILVLTALLVPVALVSKLRRGEKPSGNIRTVCILTVVNLCIAVLAILWRSHAVVGLRIRLGGVFSYFSADRIYWLLPVSWYVILALDLREIWGYFKENSIVLRIAGTLTALAVILLTAKNIYIESGFYHNLHLMLPGEYYVMTWDQFYATDLMPKAAEIIRNTDGLEQSEYRVVSLGINPAASLYNGFYTLDGYSNNYPLEYKHRFRQIIAGELEKSDYLRWYFDEWGNRCYLFNSETGDCMTVYKNGGNSYRSISIASDKLLEMNCRYVLSALPVDNAAELGWESVCDEPVTSPMSYYSIYIYRVCGTQE